MGNQNIRRNWVNVLAFAVVVMATSNVKGYVTRDTLPEKSPGVNSLVVITHGILSDAEDWVSDMSFAIEQQLAGNSDWDVWAYDWRDAANTVFPWQFRANAISEGEILGSYLSNLSEPYDHIHFIGHSAGAMLIDTAADQFPILGAIDRYTTIQTTFLDAANVSGSPPIDFGINADWAEHYISLDGLIYTESYLPYAVNIDVTELTFNPTHSWPHEWYLSSIQNSGSPDYFADQWGFATTLEYNGLLPSHDDWSRGNVINLTCMEGDVNCDGHVDLLDLVILGENFNSSGAERWDGDLNGDTLVDLLDLTTLGENYGNVAIPEPSAVGFWLMMVILGSKRIGRLKS